VTRALARGASRVVLLAALGVACGGAEGTAPAETPSAVRPAIIAIAPVRVCPGAAFTLVVTGTGFSGQSVVRVNGTAHVTTAVSETELRAAIAPSELAAGNAAITVANGTTVGATGATLTVGGSSSTTLTGAPTGGAAVGQASFALSIDGTNFTPTTVATWGTAPRPTTYVRPTRIVATIDAQDVASAGQFTIGALDTANYCRSSAGLPFTVSPIGAATSSGLKSISTWATAMLWHPGLGRLLIASRSGDLTRGYLFAVDPVTGRATDSLFVDPEPGRMAMTDDGKYLFLQTKSLDSPQLVKRVQISPLSVLSQFTVGGYIADIAAVPGSSTSVAVAEGGSAKITIYDNGVARPVALGAGLSITFGDANRLYGYFGFSPAGIATNVVASDGVRTSSSVEGFFTGTSTYLEYHAGRLYLSSGYAFDVERMDRVLGYIGRTPADWDIKSGDALAVDDRRGRGYEIHNGRLTAWDLNTFQALGSVKAAPAPQYLPPITFLSHAVRWGTDGLAYNDMGYVYIFRSPLMVP
jgi:hypothetical protein